MMKAKAPLELIFKILVVVLLSLTVIFQYQILNKFDKIYLRGGSVSIDSFSNVPVEVKNKVQISSEFSDFSPLPVKVLNSVDVKNEGLEKLEKTIFSVPREYEGMKYESYKISVYEE